VQRASLANEYGTGTTGSGSDDVLRCVVDVYAQASIHIFLQVVYIFHGASVSAATACTGALFALAHTYHRVPVCILKPTTIQFAHASS
jgi:hypothetical protein